MVPRWINWLAITTAVLTWFLIIVGGVVHGTGSSLACPDWPTCYGSFFPEMTGGIFFEHSHRIVAATVGLLTVILWIALLNRGDRRLKRLSLLAVLLVIFQGALGGITVIYRLPTAVSTAHLATSMLFFALVTWIAFLTHSENCQLASEGSDLGRLPFWASMVATLVYFQLVLGGLVRHTGAGLACVEIPLCQGSFWPAGAPPILQVHMLHRLAGVVVGLAILALSVRVYGRASQSRFIKTLAGCAPILVLLQILLGLWSIHSGLGLFPVTAHLAVGALIWIDLFLMNLAMRRIHHGSSRLVREIEWNPSQV